MTSVAEEHAPYASEQDRVQMLTLRMVRDRVFRSRVLKAYDRRCAFTGFQFININVLRYGPSTGSERFTRLCPGQAAHALTQDERDWARPSTRSGRTEKEEAGFPIWSGMTKKGWHVPLLG
jgi:hypothetical protein